MRTTCLTEDRVTVELTEFELTALVALVERGQDGVSLDRNSGHYEMRQTIHTVANEFRSLLGHFELAVQAANE